jgi:hypothetical protein
MIIVGDVGAGRIGNLTKDQAVAWLEAKDSRNYNVTLRQKLGSCVENIQSASSAPGGGSTRYTFEGTPIHHASNGAGANQGVSVFYVKRPGNVAKCVAVGYHIGAQTYQLTWTHHDWSAMRHETKLTLDR